MVKLWNNGLQKNLAYDFVGPSFNNIMVYQKLQWEFAREKRKL